MPNSKQIWQGWDGVHYLSKNGSWGLPFDGVLKTTGLAQADGLELNYHTHS
jgi:hypothetical protein